MAVQGLGNCCSRTGAQVLSSEDLDAVLKCIVGLLQAACSSAAAIVEDSYHSRYGFTCQISSCS